VPTTLTIAIGCIKSIQNIALTIIAKKNKICLMEYIKIIVELLSKLDFSFWQIFWVVIIVLFRKQIIVLIGRVVTIKSPVGEVDLVIEKAKIVEEIKNVQNVVSTLPDGDEKKNEISEGLQSLNREVLVDALEKIRAKTTYLWPELEFAYKKQKTKIKVPIRSKTFSIIKSDLDLLESSGLLEYIYKTDKEYIYESILQMTVKIEIELFELIKIIQERNKFIMK
jgi:hypothetical protein